MMTPSEIASKVKSILASKLDVSLAKLDMDSRLIEDLGMDSFGAIEMAFELEDVFSVKIPDADLQKALTVRDIVDYIVSRVSETGADKK